MINKLNLEAEYISAMTDFIFEQKWKTAAHNHVSERQRTPPIGFKPSDL